MLAYHAMQHVIWYPYFEEYLNIYFHKNHFLKLWKNELHYELIPGVFLQLQILLQLEILEIPLNEKLNLVLAIDQL